MVLFVLIFKYKDKSKQQNAKNAVMNVFILEYEGISADFFSCF